MPAKWSEAGKQPGDGRQPGAPTPATGATKAAWRALVIYGGLSLAGALIFWLVTTFAGSYPAVARYGGAVWIFILLMIVLMPFVIPRVGVTGASSLPGGPEEEREEP